MLIGCMVGCVRGKVRVIVREGVCGGVGWRRVVSCRTLSVEPGRLADSVPTRRLVGTPWIGKGK